MGQVWQRLSVTLCEAHSERGEFGVVDVRGGEEWDTTGDDDTGAR